MSTDAYTKVTIFFIGMLVVLPLKANDNPRYSQADPIASVTTHLTSDNKHMEPLLVAANSDWQPVGDTTLDSCRGGFTTPTGLILSIGIERIISINGDVVSHTMLQTGDLSTATGEHNSAARQDIALGSITQVGPNNTYRSALDQTIAGTFVQNTLNNQSIRSQTIINSTVNSASLLKDLNFQSTLRDSIISAILVK